MLSRQLEGYELFHNNINMVIQLRECRRFVAETQPLMTRAREGWFTDADVDLVNSWCLLRQHPQQPHLGLFLGLCQQR